MHFLFNFPLHVNAVSLFGLTLILGLIGGELAWRCKFFPKISGYIAVGFLVGPNVFNIVTQSLLSGSRIFVDISLGLILFSLGRHLDLAWLKRDPVILGMAIAESAFTFTFVTLLFWLYHFSWLNSALIGTIAVATAPAVVLMIADDLQSNGPVTRRTLILTSLNNLFALLLFTILLRLTQSDSHLHMVQHIAYQLLGSILLGLFTFYITLLLAYLIGKQNQEQFILLIGAVTFTIGLAAIFKLSTMLTLVVFGVAARNLNYRYLLMEIDFGLLGKLFFIILFVITGVHLQIRGIWEATLIVSAFLFIRTAAKFSGIWLFAKSSLLTSKQAWALCFSLTPMAGLAVGMSNIILDFNPDLSHKLMTIVITPVAILNILGPIAVQLAFMKTDEAISEDERVKNEYTASI